jgi:hypothetical protein
MEVECLSFPDRRHHLRRPAPERCCRKDFSFTILGIAFALALARLARKLVDAFRPVAQNQLAVAVVRRTGAARIGEETGSIRAGRRIR